MSELYNRIERLCAQNKVTITAMCRESGASRASLSDLKVGRKQSLSTDTLDKIANYFSTTVDYLLGRTDDPSNYDDGDVLAEIPLSYVEACDGDVRRARALMLAVDEDVLKEKKPTQEGEHAVSDDDIKFALFGGDGEITDAMYDEVKRFAQMVKLREEAEKKKE